MGSILDRSIVIPAETVAAEALHTDNIVHQNGKVFSMIFGPAWLLAFDTDGVLDKSFGDNGKLYSPESPHRPFPTYIAVQPDGKIILSHQTVEGLFVCRFDADGSRDEDFTVRPFHITRAEEYIYHIAVQPDGKILLSGCSGDDVCRGDHYVMRLLPNGEPDLDFCRIGRIITPCSYYLYIYHAVAVQSDGKILVAAIKPHPDTSASAGRKPYYTLIRYNTDGSLDTHFCYEGLVHTPEKVGVMFDFVLLPDGRMVVLHAFYCRDTGHDHLLVCYNPDGSLHEAFGERGVVSTGIDFYEEGLSLTLRYDGALILQGYTSGSDVGRNLTILVYR